MDWQPQTFQPSQTSQAWTPQTFQPAQSGQPVIQNPNSFAQNPTLQNFGNAALNTVKDFPDEMLNSFANIGAMARGTKPIITNDIGQSLGNVASMALPFMAVPEDTVNSSNVSPFSPQARSVSTTPATNLAAKNIADVVNRDNINYSSIPADQNLLQAGGKAATARAESIVTRGNSAGDLITDYLVNRKTQLPSDLSDALGKTFVEGNYPAVLDAIKTNAKLNAQPAYEAAYNALDRINDPQINQALDRAVAAGDWPVLTNEASKLAAYEGRTLPTLEAIKNSGKQVVSSSSILDSSGQPIQNSITLPDVNFSTQDLDYMTRALRNLGQGTEGMGAFGNKTPLGAMRSNTAGIIRDRLKELNPDFATATDQYAGDIALHDAAQAGKQANLFSLNWKNAVNDYGQLSPPEQMAWRLGQAENLQTMIANNPGAALTRMNSPQFSKVMQNFYSPSEYQSLTSGLGQLAKESNQTRQISGNSRTATRAIQQAGDANDASNIMEDMVRNGPKKTLKDAFIDNLANRLFNTPVRQDADQMVAQTMLSTPFQIAGQQAAGNVNPAISSALMRQPFNNTNFNAVNNFNASRNSILNSNYLSPFSNYLLTNQSGNQQ